MSHPSTLSRPLAQRVAGLKPPVEHNQAEPNTPENVIEAAGAALDRGETHYTDRPGIPELRGLVADRLNAAYGLKIEPPQVTITCGATEAVYASVNLLAADTKTLVVPGSSSKLDLLTALADIHITQEASAPAGSAIYLTPLDDVETWLAAAIEKDWWVIWDLTDQEAQSSHPAQHEALAGKVVTIDDLEGEMPGWRIGWMAGSKRWSELRATKQALTICSTAVSQWAALEYMRTHHA